MHAINLHFLTRVTDAAEMSLLYGALFGCGVRKSISRHEAASLCSLVELLESCLQLPDGKNGAAALQLLDGFYFSYTISHIGKEFDLLKFSADGSCALNIELKSETVGEDRIRRQLEQNRYYLSHTARTILSFTYVMDEGKLYTMNDRNYLRICSAEELTDALARPVLQDFAAEGIDHLFHAADYLISPVAEPEKYLQHKYFLTNQQADFRRRILDHLQTEKAPLISVSGPAGTGKTLLLFDLAMQLSEKHSVLFVHAGPLRPGHLVIDRRLLKVTIRSGEEAFPTGMLQAYACLLIDEANHMNLPFLQELLHEAGALGIPVILAYDPHRLLFEQHPDSEESAFEDNLAQTGTLALVFSGNIRINRPVSAFLHALFHPKEQEGRPDYSCIDVLYAKDEEEARLAEAWFCRQGYELITASGSLYQENELIAQEYDKVIMTLDDNFYYDQADCLCVKNEETAKLRLLYEGLLRTRKKLCLLVIGSHSLFRQILSIKLGEVKRDGSL